MEFNKNYNDNGEFHNRFFLSSDTMNATLLAMTNSAAESFIIMNSIFFGNSDIGIYTVVGETAFYTLII